MLPPLLPSIQSLLVLAFSVAFNASRWFELKFSHVTGTNSIKIGLPGKSILGDYFQENMTSRRPFLLLRICFPGRPIFIQLPPEFTNVTAADFDNSNNVSETVNRTFVVVQVSPRQTSFF